MSPWSQDISKAPRGQMVPQEQQRRGEGGENWRYEIKYGPEGEDHYAWIYKDGQFIATMKTWHAREIVEAMSDLIAERVRHEADIDSLTRSYVDDVMRLRDERDAALKAERQRAIDDVLSMLCCHELYKYRPKAFEGFVEYARTTLVQKPLHPTLAEQGEGRAAS